MGDFADDVKARALYEQQQRMLAAQQARRDLTQEQKAKEQQDRLDLGLDRVGENGNIELQFDTAGKNRYARLHEKESSEYQAYNVRDENQRLQEYSRERDAADARRAPTTSYANADESRGLANAARVYQNESLNMSRDAALGNAPSVAQAAFANALDAQRRQQASLAASARGGGLARASAQTQAVNNAAALGQQSAGQMAQLRASEMAQARGEYAQGSAVTRGQDLGQQAQDASQAQFLTGTALAQQQANDARAAFYENQKTGLAGQVFQGQMARQGGIENAIGMDLGQQNANSGATARAEARSDSWTNKAVQTAGAIGGAVLPVLAASDERAKKDIRDGTDKALSFVNALHARDYKYKDPNTPTTSPGRHTSAMAQDLEKSELGRRMVHDTPQGKVVDYREGFATMLAGLAAMKDEMADLKAAFKARAGARKAAQ